MTQPSRAADALRASVERQRRQQEVARQGTGASARPTETGIERPDTDQEQQ